MSESKTLASVPKMAAAGAKDRLMSKESKTLTRVPKMAVAGAKEEARCFFSDCVCCWHRVCSPWIPRVAPGRDYVCMPAAADDSPAWSLLVGSLSHTAAISASVLGLHEFRVARSGRVLGGSDDALKVRHTVETKDGVGIATAKAALTPDGRSICLFSEYLEGESHFTATPLAQRLQLTCKSRGERGRRGRGRARDMPKARAITITALPRLPLEPFMRCCPVSAAGRVWAPSVCPERNGPCVVAMHRLDKDAGRWEQVGDIFQFSHQMEIPGHWGGSFFQGYSVLHDDTILVSLRSAQGVFLTFNCSNGTWAEVTTQNPTKKPYVPILGRGVYMKEDAEDYGIVYFIRFNRIYAYKLCYDQDQDHPKLKLEPPTVVDSVCPFEEEGYGFLTHLGGGLMCAVWVNTKHYCSCDDRHVLITAFRLRSQLKRIDILHSTCRRLDVTPGPGPFTFHEFCFLQEYEDKHAIPPSTLALRKLDDPTFPHVIESSKMFDCCREFLSPKPLRYHVFEEPTVQINKDLYLFCKARNQVMVYVAKIENGKCHDKVLRQKYSLSISDKGFEVLPWHLVFSSSSSNVYAVLRGEDCVRMYNMEEAPQYVQPTKLSSDPFSIVLEVGHKIIAVTDTLGVFYRDQYEPKWLRCHHCADDSLILYKEGNKNMKSNHNRLVLKERSHLTGYAVLSEKSFVVSDANSNSILLYDLRHERWRVLGVAEPGTQLLNGRSVFAHGFIYTCTDGGILARELVLHNEDDSKDFRVRDPIFLEFSWQLPWQKSWMGERMCLDCVDKDKIPGTITFCVVQGNYCCFLKGSNDVYITTVQVKTKTSLRGKREPAKIKHVAVGTCFIEHKERFVWTGSCFAVGN